MKLAVRRIGRGEPTRIPDQLALYMVAAAFGTTPDVIREWPADDYLFASQVLGALR